LGEEFVFVTPNPVCCCLCSSHSALLDCRGWTPR